MTISKEQIKAWADEVCAAVPADGEFKWTDIFQVVPLIMQIVEKVEGLTGAEKLDTFTQIGTYVIEETDTPWVPDSVTDPLMIAALPHLAELLCKVAKGEFEINKPSA